MLPNTSNTLTPLNRVFRLLRQYKKETRSILLYAVVAGLIGLSLPLGVQAIIGIIAGGSINASWGVLVFFIVLGALFVGVLRLVQFSIMEYLQRRIFTEAALEFAVRIPRLDLEQLNKEYLPELVNRFFDTTNLQKGLPKIIIEGTTAVMSILLSVVLLSLYHPAFVTIALLLLVTMIVLFYFLGPLGMKTSLEESKYKYKLAYWLEEVGRVAFMFKLGGKNRLPVLRADELITQYLAAREKHWRILLIQFFGGLFFRIVVLSTFFVSGSVLVMNNELNLGQFVASEILVIYIIDAVDKLILLFETGYDVLTATEKIGQVTDLPLEKEEGLQIEEFSKEKRLTIEAVNLSYTHSDALFPTFNNLNFVIQPQERVAITGYSGEGKSTLLQILALQRQSYAGTLLVNNYSTRNINIRSLRHLIGELSAHEDVFKGSILENITLGAEDIALPKVLQTIAKVGLLEFVQNAEQGIQTLLLPSGKNLPGHIVSKILLARAMVKQPELLLLDKPMTSIDFGDRFQIAQVLTDKNQTWTLICATEDAVLAAMCDRVLVLAKGQIVFDGSFSEVMRSEHGQHIFRFSSPQKTENTNL